MLYADMIQRRAKAREQIKELQKKIEAKKERLALEKNSLEYLVTEQEIHILLHKIRVYEAQICLYDSVLGADDTTDLPAPLDEAGLLDKINERLWMK